MSTYWGYCCRDCKIETDKWLNRGEAALSELFQATKILDGYEFGHAEAGIYDYGWIAEEVREFIDDHLTHDVVLKNEYGDIKEIEKPKRRDTEKHTTSYKAI